MLTIFTIPKPFLGQIRIIQRNAIQSWLALKPPCELILFGDEEGVAETAKEFGMLHIPGVQKNEYGTPLLNSSFNLAQQKAKNETLVYVNADILLFQSLIEAVEKIKKPFYLMSGRRWDLMIEQEIDFLKPDWQNELLSKLARDGRLHGSSGIDYFVFPRQLEHNMPSFAVGRPGWDNWFIYAMRAKEIPVIDATAAITIIHQNHPAVYRIHDAESQRNCQLAGGLTRMLCLRDADWILYPYGLSRPRLARRIYCSVSASYTWRTMLGFKRNLQRMFSV